MSKAGAKLNILQARLQRLEELIRNLKTPAEAGVVLDVVRTRIHQINEAYFEYAHEVWAADTNFLVDAEPVLE